MKQSLKKVVTKCVANDILTSRYRARIKGIYWSLMSRECSCFDINGFTKEFFRAGASVAEMHLHRYTRRVTQEDLHVPCLANAGTNANVTYWTYLGRTEIRQDSRFLFPYLSLFYMNPFIKGFVKPG